MIHCVICGVDQDHVWYAHCGREATRNKVNLIRFAGIDYQVHVWIEGRVETEQFMGKSVVSVVTETQENGKEK